MYTTYCPSCGSEITTTVKPTSLNFEYCGKCPSPTIGGVVPLLYPGATSQVVDGRTVITIDHKPYQLKK